MLAERYAVDAIHRGVAHDAKPRELDVYLLVGSKHAAQAVDVISLGVDGVGHGLVIGMYLAVASGGFYHIAHDDERLVAKHLSQEVDVLGGVGGAEVLAVVEYLMPALAVLLAHLALQYLGSLLIEGVAMCHGS